MANEEVVQLMNKYVETKTELAKLEADKIKLIEEAMPKEVRDKVAEIEAEFAGKSEKAAKDLSGLEEKIKSGVIAAGQSVSIAGLKASYHKGRVTWDAKGLESIMESNPDVGIILSPFKKQGKDYASLRLDKENKEEK
ncbi:MAG: hypothetical protein ACRDFQ_02255 [Anaerolineales bacterium]